MQSFTSQGISRVLRDVRDIIFSQHVFIHLQFDWKSSSWTFHYHRATQFLLETRGTPLLDPSPNEPDLATSTAIFKSKDAHIEPESLLQLLPKSTVQNTAWQMILPVSTSAFAISVPAASTLPAGINVSLDARLEPDASSKGAIPS